MMSQGWNVNTREKPNVDISKNGKNKRLEVHCEWDSSGGKTDTATCKKAPEL